MGTRVRWVLGLTAAAWLLVLAPANAYVDPGTGTYLFSLIVAGLAAAGMTLKLFWRRITDFFHRGDASDDGSSPDADRVTEQA